MFRRPAAMSYRYKFSHELTGPGTGQVPRLDNGGDFDVDVDAVILVRRRMRFRPYFASVTANLPCRWVRRCGKVTGSPGNSTTLIRPIRCPGFGSASSGERKLRLASEGRDSLTPTANVCSGDHRARSQSHCSQLRVGANDPGGTPPHIAVAAFRLRFAGAFLPHDPNSETCSAALRRSGTDCSSEGRRKSGCYR